MDQTAYRTIRQLPADERPYEKCEHLGPSSLSDAELLAVILRTGAEGVNVIDMSRDILSSLGSSGIAGLCRASQEDLCQIRGIGKVKAMQIRGIAELSRRIAHADIGYEAELNFNDPQTIADYYMEDLRHETQEVMYLLCLSSKGSLLKKEIISRGTVNSTMINPREIFVSALSHRAASVILMHNHPSGDPTPSEADIRVTQKTQKCAKMLGIVLLDHIVIGDHRFVSMRMEGLMDQEDEFRNAS